MNRAADAAAVAWYDCRTGKINILDESYRAEALSALAPFLTSAPDVTPVAAPPGRPAPPPVAAPAPSQDLATNKPGASLRRRIEDVEPSPLLRTLKRWFGLDAALRPWETGFRGERIAGKSLNRLRRDGWFVLHSVELPSGADIDHVAIGPPGVFTINTKHHRGGRIWLGDHAAMVNGQSTPYVRNSLFEARRAARLLTHTCGFPVEVHPVLAVVGAATVTVRTATPSVRLIDGSHAARELSGLSPVLTPSDIERIYTAAREGNSWLTPSRKPDHT
ncbi:NERD domain-containing protein [Streptomyces sp. NBC_01456]|uniref:nuclease-related domain-containing protein n=1 Tax=unclassified Streptomyces TaxID=2593676 RepID=UPI002E2F0290|nr:MULTISPECIES: nuclease-related domain-containing protein [unclassified Streptomyces]